MVVSASISSQIGGQARHHLRNDEPSFMGFFSPLTSRSIARYYLMSLDYQPGFDYVKVKTTSEGDGFSAAASWAEWFRFLCGVKKICS